MGKFNDLTGKTFGLLTVDRHAGVEKSSGGVNFQMWQCTCECGGQKVCRSNNLVSGRNKSCGCKSHGHKKHGMYDHPLRKTHACIIQRCENPKSTAFNDYGGRGIEICKEWRESLPAFIDYVVSIGWHEGCGLSIDRINNDGNYEPGNIRLATNVVQARNGRRNRIVEFKGDKKTIAEWAEIKEIPYARLISRLNRGWSAEKALTASSCRAA